MDGLPADFVESVPPSTEARKLRNAYLEAGIAGPASVDDAEHIASAVVAAVDLLVSWNFKHIVHFEKIIGYEAVSVLHGYKPIRIHSPKEVIEFEEEGI